MSNLIPTNDEIKAIEVMAKAAVESKYFDKIGGYSGIFSISMYAREMGLPIMTSLFGGMQNIQGKITISPQLMNSLIRKAGHSLNIESDDVHCKITGTRKDTGEVCTVSFTIQEAERAGLVKEGGAWKKYPSDMCFARALSRLGRRLFPDVIGMAYVHDEIEEEKPKKNHPQISHENPNEITIDVQKKEIETNSLKPHLEGCPAELIQFLLQKFDVKSVEDIPADKYNHVIKVIEISKNKKKEIENAKN